MRFIMQVDMDNDAFQEHPATELARLLLAVQEDVCAGVDSDTLMDVNGNTVGSWAVL